MNDRDILTGAPSGAVCVDDMNTYMDDEGTMWDIDNNEFTHNLPSIYPVRAISDIQRIVDLEDHLDREANASFILEGKVKDLERELSALQPKPTCVNCDEQEVIDNHCKCCGWLQEESKYDRLA